MHTLGEGPVPYLREAGEYRSKQQGEDGGRFCIERRREGGRKRGRYRQLF